MPTIEDYIKPSYKFVEINEMMKFPLETKIEISVAVIKQALRLCKHKAAVAFSGGKDSEVCGLMGKDVEHGILSVRRTVQRIQEGKQTKVIVTPPKTENSKRQIPIPKQIAEELIVAPEHYIMSDCETPYEPRRIEYSWKCFCKSAGLRDVKFHTLRHTFATTALEAGIDVKTLSEMLGHATVSTTMDLYCHPTLKHKQECMDKIWE